jgi:hypothetical protein
MAVQRVEPAQQDRMRDGELRLDTAEPGQRLPAAAGSSAAAWIR